MIVAPRWARGQHLLFGFDEQDGPDSGIKCEKSGSDPIDGGMYQMEVRSAKPRLAKCRENR